jgi:hypothetical protein
LQAHLATWLLGYLATWLLGYLATWLLGHHRGPRRGRRDAADKRQALFAALMSSVSCLMSERNVHVW